MKKVIYVICCSTLCLFMFHADVFAFVYYLDEFVQNNGTAIFEDTFSDGIEPPSGPYTDSDYYVIGNFDANREINGLLELSAVDGMYHENKISLEYFVINNAYSFHSDSGGDVSATVQFDMNAFCSTGFGVQIVNTVPDTDQAFAMTKIIEEDGSIQAYWGDEHMSFVEDVTAAAGAQKKVEVTLSIDTSNYVTAKWDFGADGTIEIAKANMSPLEFITGRDYSGAFGIWAVDVEYHKYDGNEDWIIGDFELLKAIDDWVAENVGDFELLHLIDYWAAGSYC